MCQEQDKTFRDYFNEGVAKAERRIMAEMRIDKENPLGMLGMIEDFE